MLGRRVSSQGRKGIMKNYLVAWITAWCLGSFLVAPFDFALNLKEGSERSYVMLYPSPLPFLLALGIQKCLTLPQLSATSVSQRVSWRLPMSLFAILFIAGAGLFIFSDPLIRLAIVVGAMVSLVALLPRLPRRQVAESLIALFLILVIVNAAYRSLYPLLLDPHNLLPPNGPTPPGH